ncbi:hypothetical protein J3R73_000109 [Labrys monachus]|uniref:HARP domain-containing protein n=1 Tax=Labrys monachus TaxID=217067 RepID=A0ABU0F7H5_9HYPH|nr:hypothetical protein [Labrys monachus]MDQ0390317.1 hypothetical protein [Labrys monachus]
MKDTDAAAEKPGAIAAFPYDRLTVERFRAAFPRARWRDDLRAWFVPGTTAGRRIDRWLGRELAGVLAHADEKGRDAFAFEPIDSPYLEAAEDLRIRTPYSKTVVEELRAVPWAWWDPDLKAWRVPFRAWEDLRRRWPSIEAAARRNEPEERRKRQEARRGTPESEDAAARAGERRRHRHPVPADALPPLQRVLMTGQGAVIFTDITGEIADDDIVRRHYGAVGPGVAVWAQWRPPTHAELVKAWPSRWPESEAERDRGWWQPTLEQLRDERRKARSKERSLATRNDGADGPRRPEEKP